MNLTSEYYRSDNRKLSFKECWNLARSWKAHEARLARGNDGNPIRRVTTTGELVEVLEENELGHYMAMMSITFTAPDESTAEEIAGATEAFGTYAELGHLIPPWQPRVDDTVRLGVDEMRARRTFRLLQEARSVFYRTDASREIQRQMMAATRRGRGIPGDDSLLRCERCPGLMGGTPWAWRWLSSRRKFCKLRRYELMRQIGMMLLAGAIGISAWGGEEPGQVRPLIPKADAGPFVRTNAPEVMPNYLQGEAWATQGRSISEMQLPLAPETQTSIELYDLLGEKHVVERRDIGEISASELPIMPTGFEALGEGDLAALLEFMSEGANH